MEADGGFARSIAWRLGRSASVSVRVLLRLAKDDGSAVIRNQQNPGFSAMQPSQRSE